MRNKWRKMDREVAALVYLEVVVVMVVVADDSGALCLYIVGS